jgi:hypothetical protein
MNEQPEKSKKSPAVALLLAFLPTAIMLSLRVLRPNISNTMLIVACVVSVICCFVSSSMLFARRSGLAILAGLFFLLLNGLIAFFLGCVASLGKL